MAVDFSFPAWLRETHSFADSLAKGAAVGGAIANARYRNQALAAQVIDSERNYALREKALQVNQEQKDIVMRSKMLELETNKQNLADTTADKEKFSKWVVSHSRLPQDQKLTDPMPDVVTAPFLNAVNQVVDNDRLAYGQSIEGKLDTAEVLRFGKIPANFQKRYRRTNDPDEQERILQEGEAELAKKTFAPGPLQKDMEYYQTVLSEGDPELIDLTRSILQSKAQKSGFSVKFGAGGTVEEVNYGPQAKSGAANAPTVAVKTDLQKDINNTRQALPLMADLEKNLRAEDVGIQGVIGETVMDRLLPQFGAGTLDPERTTNRTKLRTLVQSMLRQISPDNRFTNEDRKRIEEIMPDLGVLENVDRAKQVLSELSKVFSERNVRDMRALGSPLEMQQMSNEEIAAAVRMNLIDRNAALEFFRQNRANQ